MRKESQAKKAKEVTIETARSKEADSSLEPTANTLVLIVITDFGFWTSKAVK